MVTAYGDTASHAKAIITATRDASPDAAQVTIIKYYHIEYYVSIHTFLLGYDNILTPFSYVFIFL